MKFDDLDTQMRVYETFADFCVLPNIFIVARLDGRNFTILKKGHFEAPFRWRNEDAHRNALNAHCYWMLRKEGKNEKEATQFIEHKSVAEKNELLFSRGINFNDLPNWQKRGVGLYRVKEKKTGYNPKEQMTVQVERNKIKIDDNLPMRDAYSDFILKMVEDNL